MGIELVHILLDEESLSHSGGRYTWREWAGEASRGRSEVLPVAGSNLRETHDFGHLEKANREVTPWRLCVRRTRERPP